MEINNNFRDTGFNMNSPLIQNMFNRRNPMAYGMTDPSMSYQMNVPQTTKTFTVDGEPAPQQPIQNPSFGYPNGFYNVPPPQPQGQYITPFSMGYSTEYRNSEFCTCAGMPNSSFYNNAYNGYYNPYMIQYQQQRQAQYEAIEIKQRAEIESRVWKNISRGLNNISENPIENIEEHLKQYDVVDKNQQQQEEFKTKSKLRVTIVKGDEIICDPEKEGYYANENYRLSNQWFYYTKRQEEAKMEELIHVELYGLPYNLEIVRKIEYNNQMYDANKKEFGDDMGLIEYLNKAGILYSNALTYNQRMKNLDLANRYNRNDFTSRLLGGQTVQDRYFSQCFAPSEISGVSPGPTLGSLEVTLPTHLRNSEYERRREEFLSKILK